MVGSLSSPTLGSVDTSPWQWGWGAVEALGVCAAFLAAGLALYFEFDSNRRTRDEIERAREDDRRRQASAVTAWPSGGYILDAQHPGSTVYPEVTIRNGSDLPITDVSIIIRDEDSGEGHATELGFAPRIIVLEPGKERTFPFPGDVRLGDIIGPQRDVATLRLRFIDANGRRWERDGRGGLKNII